MKIQVKDAGQSQKINVHEHDMHYSRSKAVVGGRKAVYKCRNCPLTRTGEQIYVR